MANKLYDETDITNIANSIRSKNGKTDTYKVSEMSAAIDDLAVDKGTYIYKYYVQIRYLSSSTTVTQIIPFFTKNYSGTYISSTESLRKWLYDNGYNSTTKMYNGAYASEEYVYFVPASGRSFISNYVKTFTLQKTYIKDIPGNKAYIHELSLKKSGSTTLTTTVLSTSETEISNIDDVISLLEIFKISDGRLYFWVNKDSELSGGSYLNNSLLYVLNGTFPVYTEALQVTTVSSDIVSELGCTD